MCFFRRTLAFTLRATPLGSRAVGFGALDATTSVVGVRRPGASVVDRIARWSHLYFSGISPLREGLKRAPLEGTLQIQIWQPGERRRFFAGGDETLHNFQEWLQLLPNRSSVVQGVGKILGVILRRLLVLASPAHLTATLTAVLNEAPLA